MTSQRRQLLKYVCADYVSTNLAWLVFNCIRYYLLAVTNSGFNSLQGYLTSRTIVTGQVLFPLAMLGIYWLSGFYNQVFRKSRIDELVTTGATSLIGALVIFFAVLLNDMSDNLRLDYTLFGLLFGLLFVMVYAPRWAITTGTKRLFASGRLGFDTLIVGTGPEAADFVKRQTVLRSMGLVVRGHLRSSSDTVHPDLGSTPIYELDEAADVIGRLGIERLIVLPRPGGRSDTLRVINSLIHLELPIYVMPDAQQLVLSHSRTQNIVGDPLVDITRSEMPAATLNCKRVADILVSSLAMLAVGPLVGALALAVKADSPGPAFYRQRRIGYHKRPFDIIKLRTMRTDAETAGPALSMGDDDPRITRLGRTLRKYRLDELPQFLNVLRGEMSIVGPRPEREHYIRRIMEVAPHYALLHQVRPGITSWGMVRYGYATDVAQMVERLRYDMLYLENISLAVDMKIILYTVKTILNGSGK